MAMIETKNTSSVKQGEDYATIWNELKMLDDDKWRSKLAGVERKLKVEECTRGRETFY